MEIVLPEGLSSERNVFTPPQAWLWSKVMNEGLRGFAGEVGSSQQGEAGVLGVFCAVLT